ncbi:tRNA threonylcarbamoyladenosine biosynthesis protein TsaB [Brevundimonas sp. Leaf363]|uniref:tRNA (adenosine(37)-N6)-threonylcarbamoyltransferase complex dimerization subunit type 1 TsaB n=1 Tax=Brevundimonas sp. Leaf363 TaxID=1736353 RepID=UPI0006F743A7|nr:tRNA (adenosine(37)-N6)-threonylcarbamoyltransferase complex dimerization subunit type 1 TsaB [Brevundimonas sp. Leaf363]KQS57555.1 tRNA threonylcarbamoyladenosine biosynthesis protein TsaB [Brevundimonas sp. Leaf363]
MKILVIDTALGACTAGVFESDRALAVRSPSMDKGHQEALAPLVAEAMAEAGLTFDQLDRIGVTVGPGSFTGLRVGLAFAQGLGRALDRPVVGVSTLDALAASVEGSAIAALIDARRDRVYGRLYRDGLALGPEAALTREEALARIEALGTGVLLVGSGARLFAEAFDSIDARSAPAPGAVARLAQAADPAAAPPRPQYLREADATPPSRKPGAPRLVAS